MSLPLPLIVIPPPFKNERYPLHLIKKMNCLSRTIAFPLLIALFLHNAASAQNTDDWQLEKMPVDLETDYALSALPLPLRQDATVYLLDPQKGYYIGRQGSNGYVCFVNRTDWEWTQYRRDLYTAISFDPEGAGSIFPVCLDVAAMRASGKYTAVQIRDTVIQRLHNGIYHAPSKPGISYMLSPVMRVYPAGPENNQPITASMPHYMLYAPYFLPANARYKPGTNGLFLANPDNDILGDGKGPFGYIIVPAPDKEAATIREDGQDLLKRLAAYRPYLKAEPPASGEHHHG